MTRQVFDRYPGVTDSFSRFKGLDSDYITTLES